uniref:Uncharacterized protein n=1 Tax=Sphaerodactylus townsendi TaxID=933632 RepID=A0ACB8FC15_9SAUR
MDQDLDPEWDLEAQAEWSGDQAAPRPRQCLKSQFEGATDALPDFLVQLEAHMEQFEDEDEIEMFKGPFQEEKARPRLQRIRQGTRSVADYVSALWQLARVIQDWPEPVKIHFFKEGLHPEVAQWALVTAEPTSLAGWYMWAGEAEIWLHKVQLLKQRSSPLRKASLLPLAGTLPALRRRGAPGHRVPQ